MTIPATGKSLSVARAFAPTVAYLVLLNLGGRLALAAGFGIGPSQLVGQVFALGGTWLLEKSGKSQFGNFGQMNARRVIVAVAGGTCMQVASDLLIVAVGGFGDAVVSGYVVGAAGIVSSVVAAPIVEETVFRGLTQQAFRGVTSERMAIVVQAALFAACHTEPVQMAYSFLCGLVLGAIADKYGIGTSIGAHTICNALGLVPWPALL